VPTIPICFGVKLENDFIAKSAMKVLLHNRVTGLYLGEGGQWVKELAEAHDFEHSPAAIRRAGDLGLTNVEAYYKPC
jgi:hypothetical protein